MSAYPKRLLSIKDLNRTQANRIIEGALRAKSRPHAAPVLNDSQPPRIIALVILEPSTRTRMNFEIAAHRIGARPVLFSADGQTSLVKGESEHETLENILAMRPDLLVVRHSGDARVTQVIESTQIPTINAGDGKNEHPTQALLDAATIFEKKGRVEGEKIVFIGDVEHSRVARSGRLLFEMLGAQVAVCAPPYLLPNSKDWAHVQKFSSMGEALDWSSVCMGLRVQKERHRNKNGAELDLSAYRKDFRIEKRNLKNLKPDALIMHPGPFVADEDLSEEVLLDPRCVIHQQVTNGVYIRMLLLSEMLEGAQ